MRYLCLPVALFAASACGDPVVAPAALPPEIQANTVALNPQNVLSAVVTAQVRLADSLVVRYGIAGEALGSVTPAVALANNFAEIPVLGLRAETSYTLQVVAYGGGKAVAAETLTFSTGPLPDDLPGYVAGGPNPSPGYVVFAAGMYGLVIDNTGRVVWYRRFPNGPGLNFQAQPTGHYAARPPAADPTKPAAWMEIDPLGNVTRTLGCAGGLQPRFHDLLVRPDGSYWLLCDEVRTMDLSRHGGRADARVMGTVVQHMSAGGTLLFQWSPFDHFEITDLALAERTGAMVNWTHGNALDLDADGNLLVSFRSLSEITKIDTRSGQVLWRMGGLRNQFTFQNTPTPWFVGQHGVRATGPGRLLLLDNLGDPVASRAERYAYDAAARTARLVGFSGSLPPVTAQLGGTTQDLPGGHTLVSFGSGGRVEEYDASGNVVWRIEAPGYVFRAQRIHSLYRPGVGSAR
jgi:hypothetical protein